MFDCRQRSPSQAYLWTNLTFLLLCMKLEIELLGNEACWAFFFFFRSLIGCIPVNLSISYILKVSYHENSIRLCVAFFMHVSLLGTNFQSYNLNGKSMIYYVLNKKRCVPYQLLIRFGICRTNELFCHQISKEKIVNVFIHFLYTR